MLEQSGEGRVRHIQPEFHLGYGSTRKGVEWSLLKDDDVVNYFPNSHEYTTKGGLTENLRNLPWLEDPDEILRGSAGDDEEDDEDGQRKNKTGARGGTACEAENGCHNSSAGFLNPGDGRNAPRKRVTEFQLQDALRENVRLDADVFYPRCFGLGSSNETDDFVNEFKRGQCIAVCRRFLRESLFGPELVFRAETIFAAVKVLEREVAFGAFDGKTEEQDSDETEGDDATLCGADEIDGQGSDVCKVSAHEWAVLQGVNLRDPATALPPYRRNNDKGRVNRPKSVVRLRKKTRHSEAADAEDRLVSSTMRTAESEESGSSVDEEQGEGEVFLLGRCGMFFGSIFPSNRSAFICGLSSLLTVVENNKR